MQLRSIKLTGFKSFVDPTVITIQGEMTAIVGPNGCGKSNVVDAIRWVIGETSAKQLRGQSMSDVIFNGTSSRKPVGKAAVELIFDQAQGSLSGEYAKYSEISIRREVERDGVSTYFINGVVGRRRDILGLFLGTGLGSRSYSIIEQGMISRLIEAKPEDLRAHLEEVAGISKYKERRRETESRICRTRDNLDRLSDVREEVSKQLRHLKRQANAAKRYQQYQEQQRLLSAQLKALQWNDYQTQLQDQHQHIEQQQLQCDQVTAKQRAVESEITLLREQQLVASDKHNEVQKQFYTLGEAVARLEQQIQHHEQQTHQWQQESLAADDTWQELNLSVTQQQQMVTELTDESAQLKPSITQLEQALEQAQQTLVDCEQQHDEWRINWEQGQQAWSNSSRQTEISRNNINHFERELQVLDKQQQRLVEEQQTLATKSVSDELEPLKQQSNQLQQQWEQLQQKMGATSQAIISQRDLQADLLHQVAEQRHALQQYQARHTSLEALQQSALGDDDGHTAAWLQQHDLQHTRKLGQQLKVVSGWECAVEMVLGHHVEAQCVEDISALVRQASDLQQGRLMLLDKTKGNTSENSANSLLLTKVECDWPLQQWLAGVHIAESLQQAMEVVLQLEPHESVITKDGVWLAANWLKVSKAAQSEDSVLLRQRELDQLAKDIITSQNALGDQETSLQAAKDHLLVLETQREEEHDQFKSLTAKISNVRSELSAKQTRQQELLQQQQRVTESLNETKQRQAALDEDIKQQQLELARLCTLADDEKYQRQSLETTREDIEQALTQARAKAQEYELRHDQAQTKITHHDRQLELLQQTIGREQRQLAQVSEKRETLHQQLSQTDSPLQDLQQQLQQLLDQRLDVEKQLRVAEDHLQGFVMRVGDLEQVRSDKDKHYKKLQQALQECQMKHQAITVRQTTVLEQLQEWGREPQQLLDEMPGTVDFTEWEQQLETLNKRIDRLGPINLAAIDEHETLSQRHDYLEQQHADLTEALTILEGAIAKIDKSTRAMFRDTFQAVSKSFSDLFPSIFGGGKASLELTEADYLTTGVQVTAQPPGKRNTTIHMLSGGEKALTAIALVFSMFKLNPAPFCILDEVDAPLDDVNVGRYCNLLRAMAGNTQFLVISHNKVTISMADHLLGVTMQEAGVSRLVSVDMAAAMEMAEA